MKKLVLILLAVFALSILSGCIEPVDDGSGGAPAGGAPSGGPPVTGTVQPNPITLEQRQQAEQDNEWLSKAFEERDTSYCVNIASASTKEICNMIGTAQ